jgi:alcohol dehydrogenase
MDFPLEGLQVGREKAGLIAEMSVVDPTAGGNPVPLDIAGARTIFDMTLEGRL